MTSVVTRSIDDEMNSSRSKALQAQRRVEELLLKLQQSTVKRGEVIFSESEMEKLKQEVKTAEQELSVAMDLVASSVRRAQHAADLEIENAEKEIKKLLK
jgi:hypothetical protein